MLRCRPWLLCLLRCLWQPADARHALQKIKNDVLYRSGLCASRGKVRLMSSMRSLAQVVPCEIAVPLQCAETAEHCIVSCFFKLSGALITSILITSMLCILSPVAVIRYGLDRGNSCGVSSYAMRFCCCCCCDRRRRWSGVERGW